MLSSWTPSSFRSSLNSIGEDLTISNNAELCTNIAEELRDQVQANEGIGGEVSIYGNKDCP